MNPDEVLAYLRRQPFEPFRIHLIDGMIYEVGHPDQCIVTRTAVHVAVPKANRAYAQSIAAYALVSHQPYRTCGQPAAYLTSPTPKELRFERSKQDPTPFLRPNA